MKSEQAFPSMVNLDISTDFLLLQCVCVFVFVCVCVCVCVQMGLCVIIEDNEVVTCIHKHTRHMNHGCDKEWRDEKVPLMKVCANHHMHQESEYASFTV